MNITQICEQYGIKPATWRAYVARGQAPQPQGFDPDTGRRDWSAEAVAQWAATRPGSGARTDLRKPS